MTPCIFAPKGCRSPAAFLVLVPEGCICFEDTVQAVCHQHFETLETTGSLDVIGYLNGVVLDPELN